MIEASDLKRGARVELEGDPYLVLDLHLQTPSARGAVMLVKAKLRNLRTDLVTERTFRSGEKLVEPDYEQRPVQFLYRRGGAQRSHSAGGDRPGASSGRSRDTDEYVFMDQQTYDQFSVDAETLGRAADYLVEGLECRSMLHNGRLLGIELPHIVELRVTETEPVIPGATAKAQTKAATLETGAVIQVPPYLEAGETVRVDTREARFVERVRR